MIFVVPAAPVYNVLSPRQLYYNHLDSSTSGPAAQQEANPHWIGTFQATRHRIFAGYWEGQAEDIPGLPQPIVLAAENVMPSIFVLAYPPPQHNVIHPGRLYYRQLTSDGASTAVQAETNPHFIAKYQPTQFRKFTTGSRDYSEGGTVAAPPPPNPTTGTPPVVPTSAAPSTPVVPTTMSNSNEHRRQIAQATNRNTQRSTNVTLDVTLRASQTTTTIKDARISAFSAIIPAMAKTASAATALASGSVYVDTILKGSAVVHHPSNAAVDQTIRFVIMGA